MPGGGRLGLSLHREGGEVVLSIRDQGRGFGPEEQRRMFEPFRTASAMGTGLGLAIVFRIVRDHGGDIAVHSAPQEGTQVDVRLPLLALGLPA
jgi:signal transduction histidine kinase